MKVIITGGSSGLGFEFAKLYKEKGYDVVLVSRNIKAKDGFTCHSLDLSSIENCKKLFDMEKDADILINNAGMGTFGYFTESDFESENSLVNLNITAVMALTKLFLEEFEKRDSGIVLNIASTAGFSPSPIMANYYASKAYIIRLSQGIDFELREKGSSARVAVFAPGAINTDFNNKMGVKSRGISADKAVSKCVKDLEKGKFLILDSKISYILYFLAKVLPCQFIMKITYKIQRKKMK